MFKKPKALDKKAHKDLKFTPAKGWQFASELRTAPLVVTEMAHASKQYPVVFPGQAVKEDLEKGLGPLPVALLSLSDKGNVFVDKDGNWNARYIPAYVRQYPFTLSPVPESEEFALVIDEDAPQFAGDGEPLFKEDGESGEVLSKASGFVQSLQRDSAQTRRLTAQLEEHELLQPQQLTVGAGDDKQTMGGFRVVDEKKLAQLDDAVLAGWVRNGLMALIMAHLFSLENARLLASVQAGKAA